DRSIPVVEQRVTRRDAVYQRVTPRPEEVARVLRYLGDRWEWAYRMVRLLYATGARRHEIAALRWDQIDLERGIITIDAETKTGERRVALHPDVLEEVRSWSRDGELVHGVAEVTAAGSLNERIRRACDALKIRRWSPKG